MEASVEVVDAVDAVDADGGGLEDPAEGPRDRFHRPPQHPRHLQPRHWPPQPRKSRKTYQNHWHYNRFLALYPIIISVRNLGPS